MSDCEHSGKCPMVAHNGEIHKLSQDVAQLKQRLEPVIEVWESLSGMVKVLRAIGAIVKWFTIIGGGIATIFALMKLKGT